MRSGLLGSVSEFRGVVLEAGLCLGLGDSWSG